MTPESAQIAVAVAEVVSRELDEDYVGVWKVAWHLRRRLGSTTDEQVRELADVVIRGLEPSGVSVGELDESSGIFVAWPENVGVSRLMEKWAMLGRDPNIGEIAWLMRQR